MELPYEGFIALRYLLAKRKQAFISLISLISVIGVGVGVTALLVALALMTGLQAELRDRIIGSAAHVYVLKAGGIQDPDAEVHRMLEIPRVVGAAPVVLGKALVTSADSTGFIEIKGIDPRQERSVTNIARAMTSGSVAALTRTEGTEGILIGADLAEKLGVRVGDAVEVLTPEGATLTPFGMAMRRRALQVAGIFSLGLYEYDSAYGFVRLDVAMRMLGREHPDFVELRVDDMFEAPEVVDTIVERYGAAYQPQDWADLNRNLFSALWLEKMAISITIGLIVMVAALNIVASLVLLVMEKSRDIAILKTMGLSPARVQRMFMLQGLIIGMVGTAVGASLGLALCWFLDTYQVIRISDVYQAGTYLRFVVLPLDLLIVIVSAIVVSFVATIYPSRQAARLDPAQALRYS
jgi:lipoprotein-releasing system permease protein